MISSVSDNPPEGTQHVPDGPTSATETQFVPDGTLVASPSSPALRSPGSRDQTQHVPDLPRFGRFRALAELGAGAMGTVYRAHDDVLGRSVAIKSLHARDSGTRERFLREARAIGAVLHPNILAVYDAGTDDKTPFLVMELAAGGSLRERIRGGALPIETVREVGIQIARALAAAHAASILHRDVKPANILYANDMWKLADFGIARLPDSTLTVEGQFLGSPSYAAPESLRTGQFSPASDVYGLGATLYEALTGVPPHGDHDMPSLVRKLEQDPPPVHARRPVPAALEHAIMATLARDPAQRPSADELAHLLAVTGDAHVRAPSAGDAQLAAPRAPSARTKALALALAAVAIVLVIVALTRDKAGAASSEHPVLDPRDKLTHPLAKPRANDPNKKSSDRSNDRFSQPPPKPSTPEAQDEPPPPTPDPWGNAAVPTIVDQYGNPVDDETARKILEEMARDAQSEYDDIGRGRGRGKWKKQR